MAKKILLRIKQVKTSLRQKNIIKNKTSTAAVDPQHLRVEVAD